MRLEYLIVLGVFAVIGAIACVFILGMRAMAESRSEDGDEHDRR